jgi:hypothetical protein
LEDLQLALTAARVDQKNLGVWLRNWQVGQVLDVLVTSQRPGGELVLRVGGQQLTAATDVPVQPGTRLVLEVKQLEPLPLLRVLRAILPAPGQAVEAGGALQAAAAPAPATLGTALQALFGDPGVALPASLQGLFRQLLATVPGLPQLQDAGRLRLAVEQSGTFAEPRLLASQGQSADSDFKILLQRLLAALQAPGPGGASGPVPGEAVRELEALLGTLQLNQLASVPGDAGTARSWRIDLPFLLGDSLHNARLLIEEERGQGTGGASEAPPRYWHAELALELPALGRLVAHVRAGTERARVSIEADNPAAGNLLAGGLGDLAKAMEARGLVVEGLDVRVAPRQETSSPTPAAPAVGWQV